MFVFWASHCWAGGTMQCCPLSMPRIHAYTQTQPSFIPPRKSKSNDQLINLASFCPFKRSNDVVFDRSKSKIHNIAVFFALHNHGAEHRHTHSHTPHDAPAVNSVQVHRRCSFLSFQSSS
ncbi:hypothetical protein WN944_019765 [Citrus x changshan-huyou]|uniref:Uncharacterized protein n=1 Tax=Citrus x changshan-huyou TaxID=2935761 RepID=A0AAP0LVX3_9ROSI